MENGNHNSHGNLIIRSPPPAWVTEMLSSIRDWDLNGERGQKKGGKWVKMKESEWSWTSNGLALEDSHLVFCRQAKILKAQKAISLEERNSKYQQKQHLTNVIIFQWSKEQCHCLLLPRGCNWWDYSSEEWWTMGFLWKHSERAGQERIGQQLPVLDHRLLMPWCEGFWIKV